MSPDPDRGDIIQHVCTASLSEDLTYEPQREKTCLQVLRTTKAQTILCSLQSDQHLNWKVSHLNLLQANIQFSS